MDGNFRAGQWLVQPQLNLIQGPGGDTPVEPKAMEVLVCLAKQAGEVVPKERLMQTVWADTFVTDEVLTNSIWELRKAFHDDAKNPKVIQTVFKKGYRLIASVSFEGKPTELGLSRPPLDKGGLHGGSRRKWISGVIAVALVAAAAALRTSRNVPSAPPSPPKVVPLTSLRGSEMQPSFSPDGSQVAFAWKREEEENFDIYVKLIGSEKVVPLASNALDPAWSPDGRTIAFRRHSPTRVSIVAIPALGGTERELYSAEAWKGWGLQLRVLAWSPDGKVLAVSEVATSQQGSQILLISAETGEKRSLVPARPNSTLRFWNPRFSPDGKVLAYAAYTSATAGDIFSVPLVGGEPTQLTSANNFITGLDWLDGQTIIFAQGYESRGTLWTTPVSVYRPEELTWTGSGAHPAVSRSGKSLAFERHQADWDIWKLELMDAPRSAGKRTRLISTTRNEGYAELSPDGRKIAFMSNRSGNPEIWICEADGSAPFQLTALAAGDTNLPRWSPDGKLIVFHSNVEGNMNVYFVTVASGQRKRLTTEASVEIRPSWSRDGRWIYFGSNRTGEWQLYRVPASGGQAVQVTKHGGREAFESFDGRFVYYSKSFGHTGLWRVPTEGGAEVLIIDEPIQGEWALVNGGVCFLAREPIPTIKFYNFETKQTIEVATVDKETLLGAGFSASPDGKQMFFARIERIESDLMLVENFR